MAAATPAKRAIEAESATRRWRAAAALVRAVTTRATKRHSKLFRKVIAFARIFQRAVNLARCPGVGLCSFNTIVADTVVATAQIASRPSHIPAALALCFVMMDEINKCEARVS